MIVITKTKTIDNDENGSREATSIVAACGGLANSTFQQIIDRKARFISGNRFVNISRVVISRKDTSIIKAVPKKLVTW